MLHDVFAVPFAETAAMLERSPGAARQHASRARRRRRAAAPVPDATLPAQREVVDGRPVTVMGFTVTGGRVAAIDVLGDPERVGRLDLTAVVR